MKFKLKWRSSPQRHTEDTRVSGNVFERELTVQEQVQIMPYMIDAPRRRSMNAASLLIPRRSRFFPFGRRRLIVSPHADLPSYESMLRLDENNPKRGVKLSTLNKLPLVCPRGAPAAEGCLICLEHFPEEAARQLPCTHIFCEECIGTWLCNHRSCPVCRFEFPDEETNLIIPK